MEKNIDKLICVNIDLFNRVLMCCKITSDQDLNPDYSKNLYLIENSKYEKIINKFKRLLKFDEDKSFMNVKGADLSRYNDLKDDYLSVSVINEVNKKNKIKRNKSINEEKQIELGIKVLDEIEKIKKIPETISRIKKEIKEVKDYDLSPNINSLELKFLTLYNNGSYLEDYEYVLKELDSIIKKTYQNKINRDVNDDKNIYLVKNEKDLKILDSANMDNFSYGFIYGADSIKRVYDKNNDAFVSFDNLDKDSAVIEIYDEKPIGIYAVTYGEKSLNPNYNNAQNLSIRRSLPFIELDKTLLMDNVSTNELIDNMLDQKGVKISNKDEEFYKQFDLFINDFMNIKLEKYDESNIINLFEIYFQMIYSQRYLNLDSTLDNPDTNPQRLKDIFEHNIYYDFNIFKDIKVNKSILSKFRDTFIKYASDYNLNSVYPGVNVVLTELYHADDERMNEIVNIINNSSKRDSWLIANLINPRHKPRKVEYEIPKVNPIKKITDERKRYLALCEFLKSKDIDRNQSIRFRTP